MKITTRARLALARLLTPESQKAAPYLFPTFQGGQAMWHMDNFRTYTREGYDLNGVIFSAIRYKARTLGSGKLTAYSGDLDNPITVPMTHPLVQLLERPNPYQSWIEFQEQRVTYLNLAGNSYTMLDRAKRGGVPKALYNLRPDRVYIVPSDRTLLGFLYVPDDRTQFNGVPILTEDMIHIKFPNPGDRFEGLGYGLSPLAALSQSGDVDNAVTRYLKVFFERGGMPQGIYKSKLPLDDGEVARIRARWQEVYGGVDNWTDIAVIDVEGDYQRVALSFNEMGFELIDSRNETRILGPFGVPSVLLGITRIGSQRGVFSNHQEARQACWEDTLLPEQNLFLADDAYYLGVPDEGIFLRYDNSGIPALQQDTPVLVDAAQKLFSMGVPANQAFHVVGLRVKPVPGGDTSYVPATMVAVGTAVDAPEQTAVGTPTAEDSPPKSGHAPPKALLSILPKPALGWSADDRARSQEERQRLWKAADQVAVNHEAAFRKTAKAQFEQDKREVLALVGEMKRKSLQRKAAIQWNDMSADVRDVLQQAGGRWRAAFTPQIAGVVTDAADHWQTEAGLSFDVRNLEAEQWFTDYTLHFADPIQQTSADEIAALLQQGTREGWSVPAMQDALTQTFQQWISGDIASADFAGERLPPYRAEMIARTETIRAYGAGSTQIYAANGVQQKQWLATLDGREREAHAEADGQVVYTHEPFIVGGEALDYPGDPAGSPGNTVNCRCTVLPVIDGETAIEGHAPGTTVDWNEPIATLDGMMDRDIGTPGDTLDSLNAFLQQSNGQLAYAIADPVTGMVSVDANDLFIINREVVKKEAAAFVKESQNIQYSREYLLQSAMDHAAENGATVDARDIEALFNQQYAIRAQAIQTLADIDHIQLTEAQVRRLSQTIDGNYLDLVYNRAGSESGSLANAAGRRGGQKLKGAALQEARRNFQDWVLGIDTV